MRTLCKFLLLALCLVGAARFCHHKTAGFRIAKISPNFGPAATVSSTEMPPLEGRFTYLGRGLQSFAFLSEDKTTVLKILGNSYQKRIAQWNLLPSLWGKEKVTYLEEKLEKTFKSYEIAWEELREETGLLYVHLSPTTHLKQRVEIVDKLGIVHPIDLDQRAFILQKKATLAYPSFTAWRKSGSEAEAKQALHQLVQLITARCKKGIADNDPLIRTNLGFTGTTPIFIDLGPFSKNEKMKNPEHYLPEIDKITTSLKRWIGENYPELSSFLEEQLYELHENIH